MKEGAGNAGCRPHPSTPQKRYEPKGEIGATPSQQPWLDSFRASCKGLVAEKAPYSPQNVGRRLRELAEGRNSGSPVPKQSCVLSSKIEMNEKITIEHDKVIELHRGSPRSCPKLA
jgi:hypothetical protein